VNGQGRDYYQVLGVPRDANQKDIRSAFRKLARRYHPDVNPNNPEVTERFKEINEANEVLSDPDKRAKYDQYGPQWQQYEAWEQAGRPGRPPFQEAGQAEPHVEYRTVNPDDLNDLFGSTEPFSDFFHDLFGRTGEGTRRRTAQPAPRQGEDVEVESAISLEEAYHGTTQAVEIEGPRGTRTVEVRIPPGVRDGARVRAAGQGSEGVGGGEPGHLYLRIHILPHPIFVREDDDLRVRVPVPLDIALLGGEVNVPTLKGGTVVLRVPPDTQNGTRLRLRGQGMPRLRGKGHGDLFAEVDVRLPVPLNEQQRRAAEMLREAREHVGV
jgi:curved DNA-binding protein